MRQVERECVMIGVSDFVGGCASAQAFLDAIPSPVFVLDEDIRIVGLNSPAKHLFDNFQRPAPSQPETPTEAALIMNPAARRGEIDARVYCLAPGLVADAFRGNNALRQRARAKITTPEGVREFEMLLSAARVEIDGAPRVLLVIEEPPAPAKPDGVVAICARCKKLRDEQNRWSSPERFLNDRFGLRLTHGLCPDCLSASLAEIGTEHDEFA